MNFEDKLAIKYHLQRRICAYRLLVRASHESSKESKHVAQFDSTGLLNAVKTTILIDEDVVISDGATH
ncbi:hypothetical protein CIB87_02725 [Priestia megaterium]|uniref:Uncharacterized protein n=1 Tax=Priestia megaterium TaxID=1404 RepID=A0AA86HWP4_PRIMG|nr:hypothetical protein [Priestia megaterium]AXI27977.1 hypothetical protein CIB87_02725 [Priestia megaterium]